MTKSQTKRALLLSVLSMLLCCTMLIGTTFAWFTDSVESGVNQIVAGNLDIELYYGTVSENAITYEDKVESTTLLFNEDALWEPGYTEVAYLKVDNVGTLALKALFTVNFSKQVAGTNVEDRDFKLSDHLMYDLVEIEAGDFYATREEARLAAEAGAVKIATEQNEIHLTADDDALYYALVVYMPEEVGNDANYKTGTTPPSIELCITLIATQDTVENDSFDNQYDKDSEYPSSIKNNEGLFEALESSDNVTIKNGNYTLPLAIPEGKTVNVEGGDFSVEGGDKSQAAFDLGKGGTLTISASDITVTDYNTAVEVSEDSTLVINAGTYASSNIQVINAQAEGADITINGGNYEGTIGMYIREDANIVINDGTFNVWSIVMTDDDTNTCTVTINGGTFYAEVFDAYTGVRNMIIKGGAFKFDPTQYVDTEAYNVTQADGWYTVTAK